VKLPFDHPGDESPQAQGQGGFAGLAGAQDGNPLTRGDLQVQAVKNRSRSLFIPKIEIGNFDYGGFSKEFSRKDAKTQRKDARLYNYCVFAPWRLCVRKNFHR
jgi:hypothetical protein